MFDPVKHLGQGEESRDAGEDSLRPGRSESSPAARPAEGNLGPGRRGGFAAGASPSEESAEKELIDAEALGEAPSEAVSDDAARPLPPNLVARRRGGPLRKRAESRSISTTPEQRVLLLDTWQRSGLPAGDFAALVGVSKCTLFTWKKRFEELGPAGLLDQPRGWAEGEPAAGAHQTHDPDAQAVPSRMGLPADQRHVVPRTGSAGQPRGRGPRAARGRLPDGRGAHAGRIRTRSAPSSGPVPTSCGRPTCSPLC